MKILNLIIRTLSICAIVVIVSCTDDNEQTIREYPGIETLEVTNISELGVTFNAKILRPGKQDIIEYGFVWTDKSINPTLDNERIILTEKLTDETFSADIKTTLVKNRWYHIKAFVKTVEYTVYGIDVPYKSLGSNPAFIEDFFPKIGSWGDTIQLTGKHFKQAKNRVKFKNSTSEILSSTDSTITCIVPSNIGDLEVPIYLTVDGQTSKAKEDFKITPVEIISISNLNGSIGDELTIIGRNFDEDLTKNEVIFGDLAVGTVVYSDYNTIRVIVPIDIRNSSESITVRTKLQEVTFAEKFTLIPPEIVSMPNGIYVNEPVIITGNYFHPNRFKNKILIEGQFAETIALNGSELTVRVPVGPYPGRKAKVTIQVLDMISEYKNEVDILDDWVMVSNEIPFEFHLKNVAQANGNTYIVATNKNVSNINFLLWKFDSNNYSWEQISIPFTMKLEDAIVESNGNNIYIYVGNATNDFWEYNTVNFKWTQKSSFIGTRRSGATHFAIGDNIYIGLGAASTDYQATGYPDFYKYSSINDAWTRVSDLDLDLNAGDKRVFATSFVISGMGYITGGNTDPNDLNDQRSWSYNPNLDQWVRIADNPYPSSGTAAFVLNGYGYLSGRSWGWDSSRYNPINDLWEKSFDIIRNPKNHFAFIINNKLYIGNGTLGAEMYEYIP